MRRRRLRAQLPRNKSCFASRDNQFSWEQQAEGVPILPMLLSQVLSARHSQTGFPLLLQQLRAAFCRSLIFVADGLFSVFRRKIFKEKYHYARCVAWTRPRFWAAAPEGTKS